MAKKRKKPKYAGKIARRVLAHVRKGERRYAKGDAAVIQPLLNAGNGFTAEELDAKIRALFPGLSPEKLAEARAKAKSKE
ncbi:MAG: hypothetical protein Q7R62_03585 [bacterium]|nr:hypothetical protein [bacterium]